MNEYKASFEQGREAHYLFGMVALRNGWEWSNITLEILHPNNGKITKNGISYIVGVKSIKRQARSQKLQDKWIWVEERNVMGTDGWLYGVSDLIAFQTFSHFLIAPRHKLLRLVHKLIDFSQPPVTDPLQARYRPYTRVNRKDLIAQIQLKDIVPILWAKWKIELGFWNKIKEKFIRFFKKKKIDDK